MAAASSGKKGDKVSLAVRGQSKALTTVDRETFFRAANSVQKTHQATNFYPYVGNVVFFRKKPNLLP